MFGARVPAGAPADWWPYLVGCARKASACRWKHGKVLKVPGTMETPATLPYRLSASPNSSIMRKPGAGGAGV